MLDVFLPLSPPSTSTVPDLLRADNSPASYHYETTVGGALPVISTLQVTDAFFFFFVLASVGGVAKEA